MRYIQGIDRNQTTIFPEVVDDYIKENSSVRFIDAYVDSLDFVKLGFTYSETKDTGRKPYNPGDLLKLYIYGYLNKIRSSRQLESATHRNIELIWLMRQLQPDFKTIADFRKDNTRSIRDVCRDFILLCKKLELFGRELIAIDGSKFKACNSNRRNFTKNKLSKLIKKIDDKIDSYLDDLDEGDEKEKDVKQPSAEELKEKIDQLRKHKARYQKLQSKLNLSGETQISLTDPDSQMMQSHQGKDVAYNVQIVTDSKHKLIVTHAVTNEINDMKQLHPMSFQAKKILNAKRLDVVADAGYFERENIRKCHDDQIKTYVPKPTRSHNKSLGLYTNTNFFYHSKQDTYQCPAGQTLTFRGYRIRKKSGITEKKYTTHACYTCQQRTKCTRSKTTRYIYRWEHEKIIEQLDQRMKKNPEKIKQRKALVEHPFGTIKHWMGHHHFLTRGISNVSAEMSLFVLVYNLKRVLNIVDFKELMAVVT
jgi:transposase